MDFWSVHGSTAGFFLILLLTTLPRLTLYFSFILSLGMAPWLMQTFGFLDTPFETLWIIYALAGWIAVLVAPRFVIAAAATTAYWSTDPVLVIGAWIYAYAIFKVQYNFITREPETRSETSQSETTQTANQSQEDILRQRMNEARAEVNRARQMEMEAETARKIAEEKQRKAEARRRQAEETARRLNEEWTKWFRRDPRVDGTYSNRKVLTDGWKKWWEILNVPPNATEEEIKSAFRKIARATHPDSALDRRGDPAVFRQARSAYETAMNQRIH